VKFLICEDQEGGMGVVEAQDVYDLLKELEAHRYHIPDESAPIRHWANTAKPGDRCDYSKGIIVAASGHSRSMPGCAPW
jgi:hypothetical protein